MNNEKHGGEPGTIPPKSIVDPSEVPDFTQEYHKARRGYGIVCALFLAWELIGVDVSEAPLENFRITFKSPQAVPYILFALLVYFAFRFTLEWHQSGVSRRRLNTSKIDYWTAHGIALVALGIYFYQTLSNVQIVNELFPSQNILQLGTFFAFAVITSELLGLRLHQAIRVVRLVFCLAWILFGLYICVLTNHLMWFASGAASGVVFSFILELIGHFRRKRLKAKANVAGER